ncbi:major facilitator superfamily sugar transporter [Streptantibioticus cattleyicolor NRRL 8057 = DSM 46488]|uniref:Major facilitator superfamily sugar transporter n=1 Tax=Streptantibioticus cattleyicolor (strain ATCC 35852 / DSM 46488 / JCM 4925 / NBRC 14057 / NRRL 8057) TaxID=1003195 RepID=F8JV04_STREN|nr:major facilitator superfamily sugar transporter [Streptantibioticus cattleyicolor NRRL 8057 = DSM 46488]MYS62557.1 MFS transporter [Streptomyces sp. SID5468]CCB78488.1 putative sugar efflux transporter, MFS superfamily [Streptantibioticus cattleyicolor NRRL 8057 = DSM 46488]
MPVALLALALGAFGIGTTEFVIVGLLPEVAGDLHTSIPAAGLLVTGYALGVVAGAPLMTAAGARLPRKTMLALLMVVFIAGNALCAVAATYPLLMAGRLVAALTHGAFFGIGSVVAADLVPKEKKARAIALMFTGLTIANVLGVPLGTFTGQRFGWRATFWAVTVLGAVGLAAVVALVPATPRPPAGGLRGELAVFARPQVWLALAMTTLGFAGVFASFTYLAPMMTQVAGFAPGTVSWLLVLFGAGLCAGNLIGGRAADRALMPSLYGSLAALAVVLAVFVFTVHDKTAAAVTVAVFGAAGFATVAPLQTWVMRQAGGAPALASAANIAAFNLGNALGAWLGGAAISAGWGYSAPNGIGAALSAAGLAVTAVAGAAAHRRRTPARPPVPASDPAPAPASGPGPVPTSGAVSGAGAGPDPAPGTVSASEPGSVPVPVPGSAPAPAPAPAPACGPAPGTAPPPAPPPGPAPATRASGAVRGRRRT